MKSLLYILAFLIISTQLKATLLDKNGVTLELQYKCDNIYNLLGGLKQDYAYLGLANALLTLDSEGMNLWKGTTFNLNLVNTHGQNPSPFIVGDAQGISNIANGNHTYLQEFYIAQKIKNTTVSLGLQDLNKDFIALSSCANFINSSFGVPALIPNNVPASIFPLTTLGITATSDWNDKLTTKIALYDGASTCYEENPHNVSWLLGSDDGVFAISEINYHPLGSENGFVIKIGGYYHTAMWATNAETEESEELFAYNYGLYALSEYTFNPKAERYKTTTFIQLAKSPASINELDNYVGCGVVIESLLPKTKDALSLGVARIGSFDLQIAKETTVELNYFLPIKKWIAVSPDLQYIIHPSNDATIENALVANLRLIATF